MSVSLVTGMTFCYYEVDLVSSSIELACYFGTTPQLWLNLQNNYDLYRVGRKNAKEIEAIKRYGVA